MNIKNTSTCQDNEIGDAEASPHISNLIAIIKDLDSQITEWKRAASEWNCDTPDELLNRINQLPEAY